MSGSSPSRTTPDQSARDGIGLGPSPAWAEAVWEVAEGCRRAFSHPASFTVGLEEELILLDPTTLLPANEIEEALVRLEDDRFTCELRSAQLEARTQACATVSDATRELQGARMLAADRLAGFARIAAAGVHPVSTLPIEITERERYREIAAGCPWAVREGLPCGLHVHVAIEGATRALAIYNAARGVLARARRADGELALPRGPRYRPGIVAAEAERGVPPVRHPASIPLLDRIRRVRRLGHLRRPFPRSELPVVGSSVAPRTRNARVSSRGCADPHRGGRSRGGSLPGARRLPCCSVRRGRRTSRPLDASHRREPLGCRSRRARGGTR